MLLLKTTSIPLHVLTHNLKYLFIDSMSMDSILTKNNHSI